MKRLSALSVVVLGLALLVPSAQAAPASPFTGAWYGFDPAYPVGDGSALYLNISGGVSPTISFVDTHGSICMNNDASTMFFSSLLRGTVSGAHLDAAYLWARCGDTTFDVSAWPAGYHYDAGTDTLYDGWTTFYRR
jgi:hypothetical protein